MEERTPLADYWRMLLGHRKFIGRFVLIVVGATVAVSLLMTNIYQAKALIAPVTSREGPEGTLSTLARQLGGLPGLASLPLQGSTSLAELSNLLRSNIVRGKMIEQYNLLPVLFPHRWDEEKKEWKRWSLDPRVWLGRVLNGVQDSPTVQDGLRELEEIVKVSQNLKENTITVSVDYGDPETASRMVRQLLDALNDHMTGESKRVAMLNKAYLEGQVERNPDFMIRQKIYSLIAQQIETAMMAEVKENFSFKILDPPIVPDRKIRPKRLQMAILALTASLLVAVLAAIVREYLASRNKTQPTGGSRVN